MAELAREEVETLSAELTTLTQELKILLLPRDPLDEKNVMLEVRPHWPLCRAPSSEPTLGMRTMSRAWRGHRWQEK